MATKRFLGVGGLVAVLVACGSDESNPTITEADGGDAGDVVFDGGMNDGSVDAADSSMDSSISDASADASYYVNDAGETVQECAKSKDCPTGYRCEQDGERKACVFVEGFGEEVIGECPDGLKFYITGIQCLIDECEPNPSVCPSGSTCCSDGHISWCLLTACPGKAYVVPE